MVGDTFLTISLAGCADFTVSYFHFHFHFPEKKSVQKGEVDPRAGYCFQRSSVPPRSPLHYQLENGGAKRVVTHQKKGLGKEQERLINRFG